MKDLAELFYDNGFYVLSLRVPGHGTIPAALTTVTQRDWTAAVRVGSRHVSGKIEKDMPFYIAGFSNGALLTMNYAMESIEDDRLRQPDRLFLFSPSIGVTKLAEMSKWLKMLGHRTGRTSVQTERCHKHARRHRFLFPAVRVAQRLLCRRPRYG